jgi:hypothetical protein
MAITAADYNNIRTKVVNVLGTGAGGYGITPVSSAATSTTVITTTAWNLLRTDAIKARQHQTNVDESANLPILTKTTAITESIRVQFDNFANLIVANARAVLQYSIETASSSTYTSNWTTALYHQVTLNFGTNLNANYFFNAGGQVRFRASRTGTAANTKDTDWSTNVLTPMGTIVFDYLSSRTLTGTATSAGTFPGTATGYYASPVYTTPNLPTTSTQMFYKSGTTYSANRYNLKLRADSASTPSQLTFTVSFEDLAGGNPNIDEPVTGTLTSIVEILRPSGANVNITPPTYTITALTLTPLS